MSSELRQTQPPVQPIQSIDDPRTITLLTTEHWSLLSARSLAYNEAFVRAGMFLTFLSMSFVALALVAQAMSFGDAFLAVAALVLTFDLVIGLATFLRVAGANTDDLRANHGMARIRHAYTQIAPIVKPYFTTPMHDDPEAVSMVYGNISPGMAASIGYGLTTSAGMIGLIVAMVAGVLVTVLAMLMGVEASASIWVGVAGGVLAFLVLLAYSLVTIPRVQAQLTARFPTPAEETADRGA